MATTEITTTITAQVDTIAAIYTAAYRAAYAAVERYRAAHNGRTPDSHDRVYGADVQMARRVESYAGGLLSGAYLNEETLTKVAHRDATAIVSNYAAKVEGKADGMTEVVVGRMNAAGEFVITGQKAGHTIEIRQSMVIKTSSTGTRFAQFPALVYIDGKKSTEAKLKAL